MTEFTAALQNRYARAAGAALFVICLSGVLSNSLVVSDPVATAANILAHQTQFRVGLLGEMIMLNSDIILAVALYALLKPAGPALALLGTLWRLTNAVCLAAGIIVSLVAQDCLTDKHATASFPADRLQALMWQSLDIHGTAMETGLVFFGAGAFTHAFLFWRSRLIPRLLSGAYMAVAAAILAGCFFVIVFPILDRIIAPWILAPDFLVEVSVALWLLVKGARTVSPAA